MVRRVLRGRSKKRLAGRGVLIAFAALAAAVPAPAVAAGWSNGSSVVITGASSGIGAALTRTVPWEGAIAARAGTAEVIMLTEVAATRPLKNFVNSPSAPDRMVAPNRADQPWAP